MTRENQTRFNQLINDCVLEPDDLTVIERISDFCNSSGFKVSVRRYFDVLKSEKPVRKFIIEFETQLYNLQFCNLVGHPSFGYLSMIVEIVPS